VHGGEFFVNPLAKLYGKGGMLWVGVSVGRGGGDLCAGVGGMKFAIIREESQQQGLRGKKWLPCGVREGGKKKKPAQKIDPRRCGGKIYTLQG